MPNIVIKDPIESVKGKLDILSLQFKGYSHKLEYLFSNKPRIF